jgi:hypothetical protein
MGIDYMIQTAPTQKTTKEQFRAKHTVETLKLLDNVTVAIHMSSRTGGSAIAYIGNQAIWEAHSRTQLAADLKSFGIDPERFQPG